MNNNTHLNQNNDKPLLNQLNCNPNISFSAPVTPLEVKVKPEIPTKKNISKSSTAISMPVSPIKKKDMKPITPLKPLFMTERDINGFQNSKEIPEDRVQSDSINEKNNVHLINQSTSNSDYITLLDESKDIVQILKHDDYEDEESSIKHHHKNFTEGHHSHRRRSSSRRRRHRKSRDSDRTDSD